MTQNDLEAENKAVGGKKWQLNGLMFAAVCRNQVALSDILLV